MPDYVPKVRTPLLDDDLRYAIATCYKHLFSQEIQAKRLAMLFAVLAFEHGAGADPHAPNTGRACWNCFDWDFGNRRGIDGDAGAYLMTAAENEGGKSVPVAGRWPAYSSLPTGMISWLLMMSTRYRLAWAASLTGSPLAYALAAKAGGYYTAPVSQYSAGVATWLKIYQQRWPS